MLISNIMINIIQILIKLISYYKWKKKSDVQEELS